MSRTIRRKNYEQENQSSWSNAGRKTAGYYTKSDGNWYGWSASPMTEFRVPTEQEYNDHYRRIHGESRHRNAWSPNRWHRLMREDCLRMYNKTQIHRYFKDTEHELMCKENPDSCWWDWS